MTSMQMPDVGKNPLFAYYFGNGGYTVNGNGVTTKYLCLFLFRRRISIVYKKTIHGTGYADVMIRKT